MERPSYGVLQTFNAMLWKGEVMLWKGEAMLWKGEAIL